LSTGLQLPEGARCFPQSVNHARGNNMSLISDLLEKPANLPTASKYSVMNAYIYLSLGALFILFPGSVQTIFMDAPFVAHEEGLFRVLGLTVAVIGWLYLFGGRAGGRQFGPASVLDRVVLVPAVLVPVAIAGVFPHVLLAFAALDVSLGIGAWVLHDRKT
jgi:hypothetical protein